MQEVLRLFSNYARIITLKSLWINFTALITYLVLLAVGVEASVRGYQEVNLAIFFVLLFLMLGAAFNLTAIIGAKAVGVISGIMAAADADDLSQQIRSGVNRMSAAYWKNVFGFITWTLIPFMYLILFPVQHRGFAFMTLTLVIMLYLISTTFNIGNGRVAKGIIYYTAVFGLLFFMGSWLWTGTIMPFYQNHLLRPVEAQVGALGKTMQDEADKADLARIQVLYKSRGERLKTITALKAKVEDGSATADDQKQLKAAQAEEKEFARLLDKHKGLLGQGGYPKGDRHYLEEILIEEAEESASTEPSERGGVDISNMGTPIQNSSGDFIIEAGSWQLAGSDGKPVMWNMEVSGDTLTLKSTANPFTMTLERTGPNRYAGKWKGYQRSEFAVELRFITAAKADGKFDAGRSSLFTLSKM